MMILYQAVATVVFGLICETGEGGEGFRRKGKLI